MASSSSLLGGGAGDVSGAGSPGGSSSGGGGDGGTGFLIQTGLSNQAANKAAAAQISGINQASSEYTSSTNTAIQQLMNEYGSSFSATSPYLQNAGMAGAELNYMLGLPAEQSPTAPTMTGAPQGMTSSQAGINITPASQQALQQYLTNNITQNSNGTYTYKPTGQVAGSAADLMSNASVLNNANYNTQQSNIDPTQQQIDQYIKKNTKDIGNKYEYTPTKTDASFLNPVKPINQVQQANGHGAIAVQGSGQNASLELNPKVLANATAAVTSQLQNQYNSDNAAAITAYNNSTAGQQYNQAAQQYQSQMPAAQYSQSLGQATPQGISNVVANLPGYQSQFNQGTQAIQNSASASGLLNSGNLVEQLDQFGQGMESQFYNNYVNQLAGQVQTGASLASQNSTADQNLGASLASLQTNLGTNIANSDIAKGQAQSQAITSPLSAYVNRYVPTVPQQGSSMPIYGGGNYGSSGPSALSSLGSNLGSSALAGVAGILPSLL